MLYCPLRSPLRASSRLAGGTRRSSRRRELFSIRSFLRAASWIDPGRRLERSPRQIFSASFERKLRIMRDYNAPRYSASRTRRGATPSRPAPEARLGERQREQILPPHLAAAVLARHRGEALRSLQADRGMAEIGKRLQVPPGPAAQVENRERRFALDIPQQRRDVLADVVIARALPEIVGAAVVVIQGAGGDVFQILPPEGHR